MIKKGVNYRKVNHKLQELKEFGWKNQKNS